MKRKICACILALALLLSATALIGCQSEQAIGVAGMEINENGELILKTTDGQSQNLGVVTGKDGVDGKDGQDGARGSKGAQGDKGDTGEAGKDGAPGKDGSLVINSVSAAVTAATAKGLRSSVSISAEFTGTFQTNPFRPTYYEEDYSQGGSGVIYKLDEAAGDAYIVTNYHVVYSASSNNSDKISDRISVFLYGSEYLDQAITATYVGGSANYDIAVLRVEGSDLLKTSCVKAVTLCDEGDPTVGESAIAIGNAEGEGISASYGIVSVDSEYVPMSSINGLSTVTMRLMRIDTAVNHGNSGGGLFNDEGELMGIVNAKIVEDDVENIGYAIPLSVVKGAVDNIIDHCADGSHRTVRRATLGVTVAITESKAVYDVETGLMRIEETVSVAEVDETALGNSLMVDDVILSVERNGEILEITRQYQVIDMMLTVRENDVLHMTVLRGSDEIVVDITVTAESMLSY